MKRQKVIEIDCVERRKKFDIDWEDVPGEEEVPELEIVGTQKTSPREPTLSGDYSAVWLRSLRDSVLEEQLKRQRSLLASYGEKLPDKGEKIRTRIGNLEYEKQRRMFLPRKIGADTDECQILEHSKISESSDVKTPSKDTPRQWNTGPKDVSLSSSSAQLSENPRVDAQPLKLSNEKVQNFGRESWNSKSVRETKTKERNGWRSLPRLSKCQTSENNLFSESKGSNGNLKRNETHGKRKRKEPSPYLLVDDDDDDVVIGYETPRELSLQRSPSRSSRRGKKSDDKVINLDEEEPPSPVMVEEAFELPDGLPEDICYPSRDDPNHVQVSLKDFKCLSPGEYLTSPVINFYIRYLQHHVFSENQTAADCHFFNTFFYKKITEAVSYKGSDKDAFFVKFRRWWKGFDLFRKSYIFIPIHEDLHWSLVIICIPDKEDESGLTLLHLDSLGLHPTRLIFNNVKRFLREEWNYLNQDAVSLDLPISEEVWRDLPDRINEAEVQVPRQKNDFDCGLFVLFFVKRFIEEAPQRLKLQDLGMIHRKWFKPNEASALRIKIWNKLIDLFRESEKTN